MSDIAHFVKDNLITSVPITNREWVGMLHILWKVVSLHLFLSRLKWVTLHILWKAVSSPLLLCPTGSEWHWTLDERQSHHIFSYHQLEQKVSDIAHFVKGSLITTSFPIINSLWVILHILWKTASSHLFLLPTGCEWYSMHILWKVVSLHLCPSTTGSEWHCTFYERLITSLQPITNSLWVTLHIWWKAVPSHLFLW